MSLDPVTVDTYNNSAQKLAEHFKGIGSRVEDIDLALSLAGSASESSVVEIGCGDGRDAVEIIKRVRTYTGFDPSEEMLKMARSKVPSANFVLADALTFDYPENVDVVYAFTSLLHVNQNDFKAVCQKVAHSLRNGGIFLISLKERAQYEEQIKKDQFGERMFHYYNVPLVVELAGESFMKVHESHYIVGHTNWFTLALKKA